MFVVVKFDALAQAGNIRIERFFVVLEWPEKDHFPICFQSLETLDVIGSHNALGECYYTCIL